MWKTRRPHHWETDGVPPCRRELAAWSEEGMAICSYFYEAMPEGVTVERVERWENQAGYMPFAAHRQAVTAETSGNNNNNNCNHGGIEDVELWLFHGTDAVDAVLENGFRISHANLDVRHNRYGLGVYFARDPRLAHYFAQSNRNKAVSAESAQQQQQLILARVVVGCCAPRVALRQQQQLLSPEHREPPPGFHSCTSDACPGREVIVFPGSPGTPAYPAYVLTCRCPLLSSNPYGKADLLRIDFEARRDAHAFQRYLRRFRPRLQQPMLATAIPPAASGSARSSSARNNIRRSNHGLSRGASGQMAAGGPSSGVPGGSNPQEPERPHIVNRRMSGPSVVGRLNNPFSSPAASGRGLTPGSPPGVSRATLEAAVISFVAVSAICYLFVACFLFLFVLVLLNLCYF
ncbi:unnamed protein product [Polarella glacialis]|uniref:PARP catalytic domain-containing protein n=1 Tax=Polarella glacialis TaxID=89957 RepID=A0A813I5R8_POLGL|nr:unnamed protein product [Polarella glacialis]